MTKITATHIDTGQEPQGDDVDPRIARSRAKMLDAATALLVESGPRAVTVDAISERSGVAKSTLYRHWSSRTELLVDVFRSNLPQVDEVDPALDFEHALRRHFDDVAQTFADPRWSRILPALFMLKNQFAEVDELTRIDRERKSAALDAIIQRGVAEGRLPPGLDPTVVASVLFGPMLFAMMTGDGDVAEVGRFAIDRFLDSYAAEH